MNTNDMMAKLAEIKAQQAERAAQAEAKNAMKLALLAGKGSGGERDKFGTRPDSGCGKMHSVLALAYAEGVWLATKDLITATAYVNVPNHIRTLTNVKGLCERGPLGYRLSPLGAALWHGDDKSFGFAVNDQPAPPASDEQPAEEQPKKKKPKNVRGDAIIVSETPALPAAE